MAEAGKQPRVMRILQLYPAANRERIWINLHNCWTTEAVKVTWYMVIQDILPTSERLNKLRLVDSPLSRQCGELDTVLHRVTEFGEGARIWTWTKRRIAWILHTDPAQIPRTGRRDPSSSYTRLRETGRCYGYLVQMVWYRINKGRACSVQDYSDFLRRTRWKAYQAKRRRLCVGNYLAIL
jgi:hypothetical protein